MGIEFIEVYKDKIKTEDEIKADTFTKKIMLESIQRYARSETYIFFIISAAINVGFAFSSAIIAISEGPAMESILTSPNNNFFAICVKLLPGPVIRGRAADRRGEREP